MIFAGLILTALFLDVLLLQGYFKPGFLGADLTLCALLVSASFRGRDTLMWAVLIGIVKDLFGDSLGLNLALYTLSVYVFNLLLEKFLFKNLPSLLVGGLVALTLKKIGAFLLVSVKYSFDVSLSSVVLGVVLDLIFMSVFYGTALKFQEIRERFL